MRPYLKRGDDLSVYSQDELDEVAHKLNTRPRKTLDWRTPAEAFETSVATTS
jgi:IS30 family transposase